MSVPGTLNFPTSLDDATSLIPAKNNVFTTLTAAATSGTSTLTVASTSAFPSPGGFISIDGEVIYYTGTTSTTFTGCQRGQDGTSAASHLSGANVEILIVAAFHNTLSSAAIALETKMGTGSSTPVNGKLLQGTGTGTSAWNADVYVSGSMGVGAALNANIVLGMSKTFTDPTAGTYSGSNSTINTSPSSTPGAGWYGFGGINRVNYVSTYNVDGIGALSAVANNQGTGTVTQQNAAQFQAWCLTPSGTAATTAVNVATFSATKANSSTWNIGTLSMVNIGGISLGGGSISGTNIYGLFMADYSNPAGTWTNKYALYISGGTSYHAGSFGIGAAAANSPLQVGGAIATAIATKTGNYTLLATDSVILANATTAGFNVTLPTAVGIAGRRYSVAKIDSSAHAITLQTTSSQTINGSTTAALATQWNTISVVSDGANWVVV